MATVTGVTAERVQEVEDRLIVSATRSGNDLIFTLHDNVTEIKVQNAFNLAINSWPVGSIFMNTTPTNPSSLLGGGTWVRWGKGRVPVSLDESQTEFDTVEETGGMKTHVLTLAQMPIHSHSAKTGGQSNSHTHLAMASASGAHAHAATTSTTGSHTHNTQRVNNGNTVGVQPASGTGKSTFLAQLEDVTTSTAGGHNHTLTTDVNGTHTHTVTVADTPTDHTHTIAESGSGGAHNNLQPYINVYMWKRTA